jgi:catechol 2,3-dioxygenase-like lactoylglutathione lyase family enzyme
MTTTTTAPLAISQVELTTTDLDRCCDFYVGLLGLQLVVVLRQGDPPHHRHAILQVGDTPSSLHVLERPEASGDVAQPRLGLLVADVAALEEVARRLRDAGASDGELRFQGPTFAVTYRDPDGVEGQVEAPNPGFAPAATDRCQVEQVPALVTGANAGGQAPAGAPG